MRFLEILTVLVLIITNCSMFVYCDSKVPCHFIFGDSLFDPGNNNLKNTMAKANYAPYGVDFPNGVATGRFTNGLTTADFLTTLLGLDGFTPPFSTASASESVKGVNYASGAGGIRSESGSNLGYREWLALQVRNHGTTIAKLQPFIVGPVGNYLNKCLYTVNIGSNDYINNYFMPQYYPSKSIFTPDQFATTLVTEYSNQLKALYIYGARKIAIFGLGQIGCTPAEIRMNNATQCVEEINQAVMLFNQKLPPLVDSLNKNLLGATFTFIDTIAMQIAMPPPPGINVVDTCCKVRSDFQCEPLLPPCTDRTQFVFMDGYHPTQAVNQQSAVTAFNSPSPLFVHPVDINTLVTS